MSPIVSQLSRDETNLTTFTALGHGGELLVVLAGFIDSAQAEPHTDPSHDIPTPRR